MASAGNSSSQFLIGTVKVELIRVTIGGWMTIGTK
jgi:hypothetical protein